MPPKIKKQYANAAKVEAPAPLPLFRTPAPAKAYPVAALGDILSGAVMAIMDKVHCPDALAAQSVLANAALAVQPHADVVHPSTGDARPISLFLVTVAASGERKSAADKLASEPVTIRELELREEYERASRIYRDEKAVYDKARDAILRPKAGKGDRGDERDTAKLLEGLPPPPAAPLVPWLTAPEPTLEGLHRLFAEGQPSIGLFNDEGGTFIGGHGMSDDMRIKTGAGLSGLWDGQPIKRVRAGDGSNMLTGRRLSLHIMAQPGIADGLLADRALTQQGLTSRLLVASPASLAGTRMQRDLQPSTEPALKRYSKAMLELLRRAQPRRSKYNPELNPRQIRLSSSARRLWSAFADDTERQQGPNQRLEPIRGFAGKLQEHALRMAAVLQLFDNLDAKEISRVVMERAIILARYYADEVLRVFEQESLSIELQQAQRLLIWLHGSGKRRVSLSQIYQSGPSSMRTKAKALEAAKILEDHNWLRPIQDGAVIDGKKYRQVWEIVEG